MTHSEQRFGQATAATLGRPGLPLPLMVALGASDADESRGLIRGGMIRDGMIHGVLSMDSFGFGLSPDALTEAA